MTHMGASGTLSVLSVLEVLYDDMVYKSATYLLTFSNLGLLGETIILSLAHSSVLQEIQVQ